MTRRRTRRPAVGRLGEPAPDRMDPIEFAANTALFGIGGWALENVMFGTRFSAAWRGAPVPFLPVYAAGGATVMLIAPSLKKWKLPWFVRTPIYATLLSGVEYVGCQIDRKLLNACSWDYSNESCEIPSKGCIDLPHAIIWGLLGTIGEALIWISTRADMRYRRRQLRV